MPKLKKLVYQGEISECGLACVVMIAQAWGINISLKWLRKKYPVSQKGASIDRLTDILKDIGLNAYPVFFTKDSLHEVPVPAIFHYNGNHFVVGGDKVGKSYHIFNPATGEFTYTASEFVKNATGYAIIVEGKCKATCELDDTSDVWDGKRLLNEVINNKKTLFNCSFVSLLITFIPSIIIYLFFSPFLSYFHIKKNYILLFGFLILITLSLFDYFTWKKRLSAIKGKSELTLPWLYKQLITRDIIFFENRNSAYISNRFSLFCDMLFKWQIIKDDFIVSFFIVTLSLIAMILISVELSCIALISIFFIGIISFLYDDKIKNLSHDIENKKTNLNEYIDESILGWSQVLTGNLYASRIKNFSSLSTNVINSKNKHSLTQKKITILYNVINSIEVLLLVYISVKLISNGSLNISVFFIYYVCRQLAISNIIKIYSLIQERKHFRVIADRAVDIFCEVGLVCEDDFISASECITDCISLLAISYRYPEGSQSINHINLDVCKGEKIAVVGPSGSGKSTFLKMVAGYYAPSEGEIKINGIKVGSVQKMLNKITYYSRHDDILFTGTVINNLTKSNSKSYPILVKELLYDLDLIKVINDLPLREDTVISEKNNYMSSGQKQRLLVACALSSQKDFLLFDEPTANMDYANSNLTMQAILKTSKTCIVVTHDETLLHLFDKVIRLN